jgi:DNA ligase D-like protein (predicted 3'-phosphoesterase)
MGKPETVLTDRSAGVQPVFSRCSAGPEEPTMEPTPADRSRRRSFVLHDHRRPRPHFDLRLEEDGVLRSWALPRGLPTTPTRNRLAVAVPDHDLDHLAYEDEYKSVADTGWWEEHDRNERRFVFTLHGRSAARRYALIRTDSDWLLHLTKDQPD